MIRRCSLRVAGHLNDGHRDGTGQVRQSAVVANEELAASQYGRAFAYCQTTGQIERRIADELRELGAFA